MKTYKHDAKNEITIKDFVGICIWGILVFSSVIMLPGLL